MVDQERLIKYGWPTNPPPAPFTMQSGMAGPFAQAPLARKGHSVIVHRYQRVYIHSTANGWLDLGQFETLANAYAFAAYCLAHQGPAKGQYKKHYLNLAAGWPSRTAS